MKVLSEWIEEQKNKDLLKKNLAKKLGITPTYLSMLLGGKRNPSLNLLKRICTITGIDPKNLL